MYRFVSPVILLACTGESVIEKQQNIAPSISIVSHSGGANLQEGYIESFRAQVSDDDDAFEDLQVAWYVGDDIVCDWDAPSPAGDAFCDVVFIPEDTSIIATVRDPQGAGAMEEISITVNPTEAPTAVILTPEPSQQNYSSDLIQFSALVQDLEDTPEDLTIQWSSNIDGPLVLNTTPDSSGEISDYTYLSEGQHAIELSVTDSSGKTTAEEVVIRVGGENNIPECAILSPDDQQTVLLGETVLFTGTATDADVPSTDLQVQWMSDQDGVLGTGSMNSSGNLSFSYSGFSANTHVITLQVTDEVGALCQDTRFLHVGEPPTATIDSPTNGDIYDIGDLVIFQGTVTDGEDAVNTLQTTWTSSIDGELFSGSANSSGISQFPSSTISAGVHSVTFSVVDSNGLIAEDLITFRVNTPPTQPTAVLSPDPTYSNTALSANVSGSTDADGQNVTYDYEWYENSVLTSYTSSLIPASELDVGEIWTVRVTPTDGYSQGNFTEVNTTIENSLPTITTPVISPSTTVYNDTVLTCSATASDVDQTVTPTYAWTVNGYTLTGSSLDLSTISTSMGDVVTCTASVSDANSGQASATNSVTILNRSPSIDTITLSPNAPVTNDIVMCSSSTSDLDGDSVTTSVEWQIGGAVLGSQSSMQLDASMVSPQDTLECVVTATDAQGAIVTSTQSVTIQNTNPTLDSITLSPDPVYISDTLTCTISASDIDEDVSSQISIEIQDGQGNVLSSTTGQPSLNLDLSGTGLSSGDTISCHGLVQDAYGGSDSSSTVLTLSNSAPQFDMAASITSDTGDVRTGSVLTCSATASDPNQGNVSLGYQWIIGGSILSTTDTLTIDANQSNVGEAVECIATATDSDGESSISTVSETILNTIPAISSATIQSNTGLYNDSVLECVTTIDDPDETVTPSFIWQVAGGVVGTGSTLDLATTSAIPNDTITCIVNVLDSNGGTDNDQTSETLLNRVPTAPTVSISPTNPEEGVDPITCSIDVASQDSDGQSVSYTYVWENGGSPSGYTSDVVPANALTGGEVWTCSVTASDGMDNSTAGTASVTIESAVSIGEDPSTPGLDCDDILQQNPSAGDDVYWISPNGSTPFEAYCLMSIAGGGWTVQTYIKTQGQWDTSLTGNVGVVGDTNGGFASGSDLNSVNFQVTEKIIVYLRLIEGGSDLGTQWMLNSRSSAVNYGSLLNNQSGWGYEDSFGVTSSSAGNVCTHGCSTYRGFGMFHDWNGIGYHGTQGGDYGCQDGNNICWSPRGYGCNVGSNRCSYLTGSGEGVIYAVK